MEAGPLRDVRPELYASVIRDLIRHENDVTNHRLMWLLIVQGLLANAFANMRQFQHVAVGISLGGILVTLSAFVMLYKSYHARGYLKFLGEAAKQGRLQERHLPVEGWPRKRIQHWRRRVWVCPWLERAGDLLEPYLFLPGLIVALWWVAVLLQLTPLSPWAAVGAGVVLTPVIFFVFCLAWVRSERADEQERDEQPGEAQGQAEKQIPRSAA